MQDPTPAADQSRPQFFSRSLGLDLAAVLGIVVVDLLLFWQVIFLGRFVPRGGGDLVSFLYPRFAFAAQALHQRTLPIWDPYLYAGQPYFADVQSGLLYLPNLLAFALTRAFSYHQLELLTIAQYALAGCFAYLLGRQLHLGRFGALVAAIVWECSGFLVAHFGHYNLVAASVWIPLVLALLQPSLEGRSIGWAVAAALALATSVFAGHTQISLYSGLLILIYVLGYAGLAAGPTIRRAGGATRRWLTAARALVVLGVLAIALTFVQIWASYQLTTQSIRADLSYEDATAFALLPEKLVLFVVPHFFGQTPDNYWGPPSLTENYLYVGILPLALALLALIAVRDWRARTFGLIGLIGLLLAFADWTPLHGWLFSLVPGFDKVRAPGRFIFFIDFALAMLAGLGADLLSRPWPVRRRAWFRLVLLGWGGFAVATVVVAAPLIYLRLFQNQAQNEALVQQIQTASSSFALSAFFVLATLGVLLAYRYHWLPRTGLALLVIGLILVDLVGSNSVINPTPDDPTSGYQHPAVASFLQQNLGHARIDTVTGVEDIWQPDLPALLGLRSIWGLTDPLTLTDYYWFWKIHVPGRSSRLYDLLGARYLLAHKDVTLDMQKFRLVFSADPQINVYEDPQALPRAFFVAKADPVASHDAALAAIKAVGFDPGREVVLEGGGAGSGVALPAPVAATFLQDGADTVSVRVDAPSAGYLVLSDPYYSGWEASVDGASSQLFQADWVFRAVAVPAGQHVVSFQFRPRSLILGGVISGVAWLAALLFIAWCLLRRSTPKGPLRIAEPRSGQLVG